jgi:transposase
MTIPGIDVTTAATLIGRIDRFASPRHLVGYLGLDPRSRQSGLGAVQHGHISKQGSATARHVLCEAAHATMRSPGPLRAFGQRVRARRNNKIATVAVARKLACLTWQLLTHQQDYIYERPALPHRSCASSSSPPAPPSAQTHAAAADQRRPTPPHNGRPNAKPHSTSRSATAPPSPTGSPNDHPRQLLDYSVRELTRRTVASGVVRW